MKSLERRFKNTVDRNPYWSSYTCFAEALKGEGFGKQTIRRWFSKLVENEDYEKTGKKSILAHLWHLSNMREDSQK